MLALIAPAKNSSEGCITTVNNRSSKKYCSDQEQHALADLAVYNNLYSPFPGLKALGVDVSGFPKFVACANAVEEADKKIKSVQEQGIQTRIIIICEK